MCSYVYIPKEPYFLYIKVDSIPDKKGEKGENLLKMTPSIDIQPTDQNLRHFPT